MPNLRRNIKSIALLCSISAIAAPLLTGCNVETFADVVEWYDSVIQDIPEYYIDDTQVDIKLLEKSGGRYSALSDNQKIIYSVAFKTLQEGKTTFSCCGVDYNAFLEEYGRALVALFHDHPEFFWVTRQATASAEFIEGKTTGNVTVEMEIYEHWNHENLKTAQAELDLVVDDIVSQAINLPSDYEKVKFVHNFIIQNTVYDYEALNTNGDIRTGTSAITNTAYGPLVEGRAVCSGYARAFELIMQRLGFDVSCIDGVAGEVPHEWNIIKIDGKYYHIDLTWDDAGGDPCEIVYHYFCLPEHDILKTHTPNRQFGTITATSNEANYYIKEGRYLNEYTFNSVNLIAINSKSKNEISIRFADIIELNKAYQDLIENGSIFRIEELQPFKTYRYIVNKDVYVLTFIFDTQSE